MRLHICQPDPWPAAHETITRYAKFWNQWIWDSRHVTVEHVKVYFISPWLFQSTTKWYRWHCFVAAYLAFHIFTAETKTDLNCRKIQQLDKQRPAAYMKNIKEASKWDTLWLLLKCYRITWLDHWILFSCKPELHRQTCILSLKLIFCFLFVFFSADE